MCTKALLSCFVIVTNFGGAGCCYGAAPGVPGSIVLPDPLPTARVLVESIEETKVETVTKEARTCPPENASRPETAANKNDGCLVTYSDVREPVTRVWTSATYGRELLSAAQLRVMSDPEWTHKLARFQEVRTSCEDAGVYATAGYGITAAGALVALGSVFVPTLLSEADKSTRDNVNRVTLLSGLAGVGLGAGTYALGYYAFGGNTCEEAEALHVKLEFDEAARSQSRIPSTVLLPAAAQALASTINKGDGLAPQEWPR